jgi:hypothetical protein
MLLRNALLCQLAFPKGLPSAAGRPRVPPSSPVIFDVNLLYIPGLEEDTEIELPALASESSSESEGQEEKAASS